MQTSDKVSTHLCEERRDSCRPLPDHRGRVHVPERRQTLRDSLRILAVFVLTVGSLSLTQRRGRRGHQGGCHVAKSGVVLVEGLPLSFVGWSTPRQVREENGSPNGSPKRRRTAMGIKLFSGC